MVLATTFALASTAFSLFSVTLAAPTANRIAKRSVSAVINSDFPDPALIKVGTTYYAFATTGDGKNARIASSSDWTTWNVLDKDALPLTTKPSWINQAGAGVWAPDVIQLDDGTFRMTYSASAASDTSKHCVGIASSSSVEGPYTPVSDAAFACPLDLGGAIDSSFFKDNDGTLYVVYKVDGNSISKSTPIMIQQVNKADGHTKIGSASQILVNGQYDGGITEAPSMMRVDNVYYLTFSSNAYNTDYYDVSYATSTSPTSGFTKSTSPLLVTNDYGLGGPGGADMLNDNGNLKMVFHANIGGPGHGGGARGMWTAAISVNTGARTMSV